MTSADNSLLSVMRLRKEVFTAAKETFNESKTLIYPGVADQQEMRASANQLHGNGETSIATA